MRTIIAALWLLAVFVVTDSSSAFCGFFVAGADDKLLNDSSAVVLMRGAGRTVLSMQNSYRGPVEDFALVVPVPVVLEKNQVHTLPRSVFERVVELTSPRLVEYWELDPCMDQDDEDRDMPSGAVVKDSSGSAVSTAAIGRVDIKAQFAVGEYEIVILGADDSSALEKWLNANQYNIPAGAEPYLRPYVTAGMYFFVARVNVQKVRFAHGQALLSPLRFHFDSERFALPIRLGLINSPGKQDLGVFIIATDRYEVANYPNAMIPTNLDVQDHTRDHFGAFYAALLARTHDLHPRAVVTEYAWATNACDPCAAEPLTEEELLTLGADAIPLVASHNAVVTRLHARYSATDAGQDLVFRKAEPIVGGREFGEKGRLEKGAVASTYNNFQARYAIRQAYDKPLTCARPVRGFWTEKGAATAGGRSTSGPQPPGRGLASFLAHNVPELDVRPNKPLRAYAGAPPGMAGCGSCAAGAGGSGALHVGLLMSLALLGGVRRRDRRVEGD